jgi:hypothetical protein
MNPGILFHANDDRAFTGRWLFLAVTLLAVAFGQGAATQPVLVLLILLAAVFVSVFSFVSAELPFVLLIFAMLLSPEFIVGNLPARDIVLRIDDMLVLLLGVVWLARAAVREKSRSVVATPLNRYIILYIAIFVFSTTRGMLTENVRPLSGLFYILKYLEYYFIYFFVVNHIKTRRQVKIYLAAFLLTLIIVDLYAASQIGHVARVAAPFQMRSREPNTLGGYQVLLFSVVTGLVLCLRSLKARLALAGIALFTLWPFLHTLSRSSYMGLVAAFIAFMFLYRPGRKALAGVFIVGAVLTVLFLPQKVRDRLADTVTGQVTQEVAPQKFFGVTVGPSASARIQSWATMFERWRQSPFFGYGVTGQGFIDGQLICALVESGMFGLLALLMLWRSIYGNVLAVYRGSRDPLFKGLALGFLGGHIGLITHALTANTFIIVRIMEPYWFLAGMVMMLPRIEKDCVRTLNAPSAGRKVFTLQPQ